VMDEAIDGGERHGGITNDVMMPFSSIAYCVARERAGLGSDRP
jgi:hypothetical protein